MIKKDKFNNFSRRRKMRRTFLRSIMAVQWRGYGNKKLVDGKDEIIILARL